MAQLVARGRRHPRHDTLANKARRSNVGGKHDGGDEEGGGDHPQCVEEVGACMVCGHEGVIKINLLLIYSFLLFTFDFIDIALNIN